MKPTKLDALVVVDLQRAFEDLAAGGGHNPACVRNVVRLVRHWRRHGGWVVYVRHDSLEKGSPLEPGSAGNLLVRDLPDDPDALIVKHVHSAFHGSPDLDTWLRARNVETVTVCGVTTDHCCETTARVACDLGYRVRFVLDATRTFPRRMPDGDLISPDTVTRVVAASLHGEFADVVDTSAVIGTERRRAERNGVYGNGSA